MAPLLLIVTSYVIDLHTYIANSYSGGNTRTVVYTVDTNKCWRAATF